MGAVIRSKNTGMYLMFTVDEAAWTGKKTAKVIGWTENINNATNISELCRVADRSEVSRIQNNPDSETLLAKFETVTRVTLEDNESAPTHVGNENEGFVNPQPDNKENNDAE